MSVGAELGNNVSIKDIWEVFEDEFNAIIEHKEL
jgi:hypothetical protein